MLCATKALDSSLLYLHHKSHLCPSLHLKVVPMLMGNCLLLFLWCLLDKSFVSPLHSSSQSRMGKEQHRNLMAHRKHGMMGVHRVKRGWVWNQFFVLEEYMGSDPQYVGKVSRKKHSQSRGFGPRVLRID